MFDLALTTKLPALAKARAETQRICALIGTATTNAPPEVAVVANGSLARAEVTSQSDFDAYALVDSKQHAAAGIELVKKMQTASGLKPASDGGAFGEAHLRSTLVENIGGQKDDNAKFTRRMLFLLESLPLAGSESYLSCVDDIINRYVSDDITHHQLGRFLLNDIVRFYRTMCVDFEFKTYEQKKAWGTRNIKLIFSRKLMYFSGVVMCAELAERNAQRKRSILKSLIVQTPVDRLLSVMGDEIVPALVHYDRFLASMDDKDTRDALAGVAIVRDTHTSEYRELKDTGHHFSWALVNALQRFYPPSHPIHDALVV